MSTDALSPRQRPGHSGISHGRPNPTVDIAIPVYNEEAALERSVRQLHAYLHRHAPFPVVITVVDNASTDSTWRIAERLATEMPGVRTLHLDQKGRGRALRTAWLASEAPVVAYMDVDLSTDLAALLPLLEPLVGREADIAIGSRLAAGADVKRGPRREVISRGYNLLLRATLGTRFRDAQCGFKAARSEVVRQLLPQVEDQAWFFDTELLVLAQRAGLRIREVPVHWVDDPDSRVKIVATALEDLRGVWRLAGSHGPVSTGTACQMRSFAAVGILSTLAYIALYSLLRTGADAGIANAVTLLVTAVGNTAANRRFTFGIRGRAGRRRDQIGGLAAFALALGVTSGSLVTLSSINATPSRGTELAVLVSANLVATLCRFVLLRAWLRRPHEQSA